MGCFALRLGLAFENEFAQRVKKVAVRKWGDASFRLSTKHENTFEGFDFVLCNIPIDVTLNFNHKSRVTKHIVEISIDSVSVTFAVRYGNAYKTFKRPVLVTGVSTQDRITTDTIQSTLDVIEKSLIEQFNVGFQYYTKVLCRCGLI